MRVRALEFSLLVSIFVSLPLPEAAHAREFAPEEKWNDWFAPNGARAALGDFDGDGRVDVATPDLGSGVMYVSLSSGDEFTGVGNVWSRGFRIGSRGHFATGDFDGDGRDDVVRIRRGARRGDVYVALSTGASFAQETLWARSVHLAEPLVGDFDGDGRDDLAFPLGAAGRGVSVTVHRSTGSSFERSTWPYRTRPSAGYGVFRVGDVDRDGDDDLVRFTSDAAGDVFVARAEPSSSAFAAEEWWHGWFSSNQPATHSHVADLNGDGRADILHFTADGTTYGAISNGASFEGMGVVYDRDFAASAGFGLVGDADGDGFADEIRFANDASGDVFVARFDPFGVGTMRVDGSAARGIRPLVTVLVDGAEPWQSSRDEYEAALAQLEDLFAWNSANQFRLRSRAVVGPFTVSGAKFAGSPVERTAHAAVEAAAEDGLDFTQFDANGDGTVSPAELDLLVIDTFSFAGGKHDHFACQGDLPGHPKGFRVCTGKMAAVGHRAALATVAHELAHKLGAIDLYGRWNEECLNTKVSLMGCTFGPAMTAASTSMHLDAWHKMALGWTRPRVRPLSGEDHRFVVSSPTLDPDRAADPILFYDPEVGPSFFFLVEARSDAVAYDAIRSPGGLVIWEVQTSDSYAPLFADGRNMVMAFGAPCGAMGGAEPWTSASPNAILSIEGSALTPEVDVVSDGPTPVAWITHDGCRASERGASTHCSEDCPCSEGAADCDDDSECAFGLSCIEDIGAQFGYSPETDVCLRSCHAHRAEGTEGYCTPACPCGEDMGLCRTAADCTPGLDCVESGSGAVCARART